MATKKSLEFAAPYRHTTFNEAHHLLVGVNGVVSGGSVSTVGSVVRVAPLIFIQNGMFVSTDYVMERPVSGSIIGPYSIAVSTPTDRQDLNEILVPVFVTRPEDVGPNLVIIADWDGSEWLERPKLQIRELIGARQSENVAQKFVGVCQGFDLSTTTETVDFSGVSATRQVSQISEGTLVDTDGALLKKKFSVEVELPFEPQGYDRVDTITYRKTGEGALRRGEFKVVLGDTFRADGSLTPQLALGLGSGQVRSRFLKTLSDGPASAGLLFIEDEGNRASLKLLSKAYGETNPLPSEAVEVANGISAADGVFNEAQSRFEFAYARGYSLYYKSISASGAVVYSERTIAQETGEILDPSIHVVGSGSSRFIHVIYRVKVSASDSRIKYVRLSLSGTKETQTSLTLVSLGQPLDQVVSAKDDRWLLSVAYRNQATLRAYLKTFDLAQYTSSGAPVAVGATEEVQDETWPVGAVTPLSPSGVGHLCIVRSGLGRTYVAWAHETSGGGSYVGVYSPHFAERYGKKAFAFLSDSRELSGLSVVGTADECLITYRTFSEAGSIESRLDKIDLERISVREELGSLSGVDSAHGRVELDPTGVIWIGASGSSGPFVPNGVAPAIVFQGPGVFGAETFGANEFVVECSTGNILSPGFDELPLIPSPGDRVGIGAEEYAVTAAYPITVNSTAYHVVAVNQSITTNGSVAQFYYPSGSSAKTYRAPSGKEKSLDRFQYTSQDTYLANIRASDGKLAASGVAIEENLPIARLYEYFNCFAGGGGTVSWEEAGLSNKLKFTQALAINFYNRKSTYTIPATVSDGVTLLQNQVLYVQIPDEDLSVDLEVKVANFGEGVLDRYGKNVYPLFWNTQGTLYTRFAPFRLASGEVIQIGDQVSRQLLDWLGATSSTPDKLQHGYSSTLRISQDNSITQAISNLDAGIESVREELTDLTLDVAEDLYAYMSQCRLVAEDTTQLRILSSDRVLPTGETLTRPLSSMKLSFEGAFIDFAQGKVFASDGLTSLGLDFTPVVLSSGHYQWFSISLVPYLIDATTNEMGAQVLVIPAASSSLSAASAPRASYPSTGMSLGMVRLQGGASGLLPIQQSSLEIIAVGGGTGTGSGGGSSEVGTTISPADGFKAVVYDYFTESSDDAESSINSAATTASYITAGQHYRILCDGTKTVSTQANLFTLSAAPSFQLRVGDILFSKDLNTFRKITAINSLTQTEGLLDEAFETNLSDASIFLSQVVVTKDLVGLGDAEEKSRLEDTFPGKLIDRISLSYTDSLAEGDTVSDFNSAARVVISASAQGRSTLPSSELFSSPYTRPTGPQAIQDYPLSVSGQGLFLTFFANPNNSEVVSGANLLSYEASVYTEELLHSGWSLDSGYKSETGDELGLTATSTFLEASPSLNLMINAGSVNTTILGGGVDAVLSWAGALSGFEVYGSGIAPGTSVSNINGGALALSAPALNSYTTAVQFRKAATEVSLSFDYVPGVREGSLEGDLEVIVGGKPIPRYSGYYVGRHYKEVAGTTDTILLSFALAPEEELVVRRRQGTIDTSSTNGAKLSLLHTAIVGTQAQVEAGVASYSTIQAAHDGVAGSGKIVILPGTYEESVAWTRDDLVLEGRGRLTVIDGDFLLSGHGNDISGIKVLGDLTLTGSDYNFVKMWLGSQSVFTPGGQFNLLSVIQE